jgi:geranylgeranyl pyrophosphate synthase
LSTTITIFNLVQDGLERVEQKMRETPRLAGRGERNPPHPVLNDALEYLVSTGGKRLRPALTLLVSHIYPAEPERVVSLAAAIELLHTATLVHDDLIDGALLRRGHTTLNAAWTPAATVLTGDYFFARAADLAAQTKSMHVIRRFSHTLMVICSGEIKQMFDKRAGLNRQGYYDRIYAKTAALFAAATESAAVLGNAPELAVAALREYGEQLGMAFQIVDDVLDFVGEESNIGKPVGSDLQSGLITLPALWFLEQHQDHELLAKILDNGHQDNASVQETVNIIRQSGAIEATLDEARQFIRRSQAALEMLSPSVYRDALWELSDFVVERNR